MEEEEKRNTRDAMEKTKEENENKKDQTQLRVDRFDTGMKKMYANLQCFIAVCTSSSLIDANNYHSYRDE